jgi:hypothetical protein
MVWMVGEGGHESKLEGGSRVGIEMMGGGEAGLS